MQRSLIQAVAPTDFTTVRDPQRSALERKACMPPAPTAIGTDDGYLVPNPEFFENTDGPNASPASTARLSLSRPSPQEIPTCGPRSDGASTLGWAREISELDSTPYAPGCRSFLRVFKKMRRKPRVFACGTHVAPTRKPLFCWHFSVLRENTGRSPDREFLPCGHG